MVKNPPANTGNTGSISGLRRSRTPWSNKVHVLQLLSLCATAQERQLLSPCAPRTEAGCLEPVLHKRGLCSEKPEPHSSEQPPLTQPEQSLCSQQSLSAAKTKQTKASEEEGWDALTSYTVALPNTDFQGARPLCLQHPTAFSLL